MGAAGIRRLGRSWMSASVWSSQASEGGPTYGSPVSFQSCCVPPHEAATSPQQGSQAEAEEAASPVSGKEYVKAVYSHPAYLTSMQSTSAKCWAG